MSGPLLRYTLRFSGHETFPLRYAWLPRAFEMLKETDALAQDDQALTELGLGRNMLKALRFWLEVTDVAQPVGNGCFERTSFGEGLFGKGGRDRYIEDPSTLWLLHWKISTHQRAPLFAWWYLLYKRTRPEFTRSELTDVFVEESRRIGPKPRSKVTVRQHIDIFLHSYLPMKRGPRSVQEDVLDCPLTDLRLVEQVGEAESDEGRRRREPLLRIRRGPKPEISDGLFEYCLLDFWRTHHGNEATLGLREVHASEFSVGLTLGLPEQELWERLERLAAANPERYRLERSAFSPAIAALGALPEASLDGVYA